MSIPSNMRILHDREYIQQPRFLEERYFRIMHELKNIPMQENGEFCIITAAKEDISAIVNIINRSYSNIRISEAQLRALTETIVYDGNLWILAKDRKTGEFVGCAIADLDKTAREGIFEWVQVLPNYRRKGVGKQLVVELLSRMQAKADFATVSGRCDDPSCPERLYRSCGFQGNDVWHILRAM